MKKTLEDRAHETARAVDRVVAGWDSPDALRTGTAGLSLSGGVEWRSPSPLDCFVKTRRAILG